jgi:hypothetical protein
VVLTKSQVNKLGEELRHGAPAEPIAEALLARLQDFRNLYEQMFWERRSAEIKEQIRAKLTAVIEGTEDLT